MTAENETPDGPDDAAEPTWAPPTGPAAADPDPTDHREIAPADAADTPLAPSVSAAVVSPIPGDVPVVGRPWIVSAHTAAGVSGLVIEIQGRPHNVTMRPDPPSASIPPTWSGTVDGIGTEPLHYRFAWRSNWTGDVTDWQTVTPAPSSSPDAISD